MTMLWIFLNGLTILILVGSFNTEVSSFCPEKCVCKSIQREGAAYLKVKCGGTEDDKLFHIDEINLMNIADEVEQLNLSNNLIDSFTPRVHLKFLHKLYLSNNLLTSIKENEFETMPRLKLIDFSHNNISYVDHAAFSKLEHLEKLKLNQNRIASIVNGTFESLVALKQIDISENPLNCDCSLLWILDWIKSREIKLVGNPKCSMPPTFKGHLLRKLKVGVDIHCKNTPTTVALTPSENQVVFEGDSLDLRCKIPTTLDSPTDLRVEWTWLDANPKFYFPDIVTETHFVNSNGFFDSYLNIKKLHKNHTGIWNCVLYSSHGNYSGGITVVVISNVTQYCPITVTSNNKGTYNWPRTIVNYTVSLSCESLNPNVNYSRQVVSYSCGKDGRWENLDDSHCSFITETTKVLQQFTKADSNISESVKSFKSYTSDLSIFKDVMDLVFAVQSIDNYLKYASRENINDALLDVVDKLLELPKSFFREAERIDGSCLKLRNAVEVLFLQVPEHKTNLMSNVFQLKINSFSGMKCTWYNAPDDEKSNKLFHCVLGNQQAGLDNEEKLTEASVTVSEGIVADLGHDSVEENANLLISLHANSNLFPVDPKIQINEDVMTSVVGVKIGNTTVNVNLTDPVYVMMKVPPLTPSEDSYYYPVWWDPESNNRSGGWSKEGCESSHEYDLHVVFYCHRLGYYGLLQNVQPLLESTIASSKFSHPAIYVGSFILFTCLVVAIMSYFLCYTAIQMPKKAKHSLINTWTAVCSLCFVYVSGIYRTENARLCQIVGMTLHYLTLCSLLWMCVSVNYMYKRTGKHGVIELQDDDLPTDQPIRKPILGLYLVGWGIGLIICGISAAINIRDYSSETHCFLRNGPALSALYVPVIILLVFLIIFFLLIRCSVYNSYVNGHLSEGTQATENVDLDLLEPNFPIIQNESRSIRSGSTNKTASSDIEDPEHSPSTQLKAYVIFLLLYLLTWLSCAFATVETFHFVPFEEDLFSIAYAILATLLGAFTLFFYCVARSDVRYRWILSYKWLRERRNCFRSRNVSDASPNLPSQIQIQPLPPVPNVGNLIDINMASRSSSRSSNRTKSNSHNSNILKAAADLNGAFTDGYGNKINNVNLIVLHRQQYRSHAIPNVIENPRTAAEVFYNPHQSTVARKFFKRQKRNMMKRNNLVVLARDQISETGSVLSEPRKLMKENKEQNIFGAKSSAKVNNTNIHVEKTKKTQSHNLNIFSDSAEEYDSSKHVPVENIVMNAERLHKRELSKQRMKKKINNSISTATEKNMRSVSQQCTLEYSSENVSDSILDRVSPDVKTMELRTASGNPVINRHENTPLGNFSTLTEDDPHYCKIDELHGSPRKKTRIYVNPSHDVTFRRGVRSRASSVSLSDLDELYQQIRRGPRFKRTLCGLTHGNAAATCLSDSEINSFGAGNGCCDRLDRRCSDVNLSDIETTV